MEKKDHHKNNVLHLDINKSLAAMSPREVALYWAEKGIPVFPCWKDKSPMTKTGFREATTDPAIINSIFSRDALVGGYYGGAGLFVIDVDSYKDPSAEEWYGDLAINTGQVHRTMNGGLHYVFKEPGTEIHDSKPHSAVEVKARGGYCILPDGVNYTVEHEGEIATFPTQLLPALRTRRADGTFGSDFELKQAMKEVCEGLVMHDNLVRIAAHRAAMGMDKSRVEEELSALVDIGIDRLREKGERDRADKLIKRLRHGAELIRAVESGYKKFDPNAATQSMIEAFQEQFGHKEANETKSPFIQIDNVQPYLADEWLIDDIIEPEIHSVIYGPSSVGKTFVGLYMAMCLATGQPFFGNKILKPIDVFYFCTEGTYGGTLNRVLALKKELFGRFDIPTPRLHIARSRFAIDNDWVPVVDTIQLRSEEMGKLIQPGQIFIDTLRENFAGEENSSTDTASFTSGLKSIGEATKSGTLTIHHTGKDPNKEERGSYNLRAYADKSFKITAKEQDNDEEKSIIFENKKARESTDGGAYEAKLALHTLGKSARKDRPDIKVPAISFVGETEHPTIGGKKKGPKRGTRANRAFQIVVALTAEHERTDKRTAFTVDEIHERSKTHSEWKVTWKDQTEKSEGWRIKGWLKTDLTNLANTHGWLDYGDELYSVSAKALEKVQK